MLMPHSPRSSCAASVMTRRVDAVTDHRCGTCRHYECNLGATPKEAYRALGTKALRVSTLERLVTVICWGRDG